MENKNKWKIRFTGFIEMHNHFSNTLIYREKTFALEKSGQIMMD